MDAQEESGRVWLRKGRLFIADGWFESDGKRYLIEHAELHLADGYLFLNGPLPPELPEDAAERRTERERRREVGRRSGSDRRSKVNG